MDDIFDYIKENEESYVARVMEYVSHPSISAHNIGIREVAGMLVHYLKGLDFDAKLIETPGHPFVLGHRTVDPSKPTVLLYGHYDVQPPDPLEAWVSPPFEPEVRDGRIWARGIGDNKGQHFAQLLAIEAHLKVTGTLPCNIIFCLEGEEEIGSPQIADFVRNHMDDLQADLVVTSDGPLHETGQPVITFGVRGVASFDLVAKGASRDVHSGNFGGIVPNPIWTLVQLLATMKDADGNITVEGITEPVIPATNLELDAASRLPLDLPEVMKDLGLEALDGPLDRPYWDRLMFHPTLTINGFHGGYGGPGSKTVLPNEAIAKCDVRLVEPLTPDHVFERIEAHVAKHAPNVEVVRHNGMLPSKTPMDTPFAATLIKAVERARGVEPLLYPTVGGSLPDYVWTKILKKPAFVVPYANADEANHAPNENLEVVRFIDGIRTGASLLFELGQ
ncbi:M20/M25/M40 family metallo-hydrolase [Sulfitobacter geojensis]|uniref:M20/M25/M40 family metallo-hydrolase n=1 Tax=Sulfitobacter geojensis TaxID=1342299 RepID=A0AAE3B7M8_9RHOB|nr:M20/M25/M40 family metallo-hydrolase [Sulfitobacter geojensis]MBM1695031.1 M20/M25/M40 family metallo-hydrolase [Sulfitobacter geojensis]MBM1707104.1 M20/M25/M40 family metallo-hydrolase [Sulfitobacter geojensis]MBM1711254.1 M20/M25/M40 family metallo-hydrolase [Sulfitobacter geojensis]MBM1715229.1 M20/M25/M40 family metallo-hydrolase [Sulfitobacter geojensis]